MKNTLSLIAILLLVFPQIMAVNLNVEVNEINNAMIYETNEPAVFELEITNLGEAGNFQFYNLQGYSMAPKGTVELGQNQKKKVQLIIYPKASSDYKGFFNFEYFIRAQDETEQAEKVAVKSIGLKDAFEIVPEEIGPESESVIIQVKNNENLEFSEINAKFSSEFFEHEEKFDLNLKETKDIDISLDKEEFKDLEAGFYTLNTEITMNGVETSIESTINFAEKDIITENEKTSGLIIRTKTISKQNKGNTLIESQTEVTKDILSRLFTTFTPKPDVVERKNFIVYYYWNQQIKPGDVSKIKIRTNWFFPFLIVAFVLVIIVLTKNFLKTNLVLRKKVSFLKTKGGEFALKVSVFVHAKKYLENVVLVERVPPIVKIYKKFFHEKPSKYNEKTRVLQWNFEKLEAEEIRKVDYIVYSKVGVLGKFELPKATAIYKKNGKTETAESNKTFFITEQGERGVDDEV